MSASAAARRRRRGRDITVAMLTTMTMMDATAFIMPSIQAPPSHFASSSNNNKATSLPPSFTLAPQPFPVENPLTVSCRTRGELGMRKRRRREAEPLYAALDLELLESEDDAIDDEGQIPLTLDDPASHDQGRWPQIRKTITGTLGGVFLPFIATTRNAVAAGSTGAGRIAGRATEIPDVPPRPDTRIERSAPRDIVRFEFGRAEGSSGGFPAFRIRDGDVPPSDGVTARPLRKTDLVILGGTAAAVGTQAYRNRAGGGGGAETDIHLVAYQVALYDTHGLMTSLQRLAQRAETTTCAGLASLASNVCLELLRGQDGWVASKAITSRYRDMTAAEKEFNEMSVRERKKWAYENSQEDRAALAAYNGPGASRKNDGKNLMVLTLMVACRRIQGNKIVPKKTGNVEALENSLEKFAAAVLEKGGRNVIAVDVSWTPDDPSDVLSRIELASKWPDLIDF